jgi:uncharacterized protein
LTIFIQANFQKTIMYFIQAYKAKNEWWRYLITLAIVAFAYLILGSIPLTIAIITKTIQNGSIDLDAFSNSLDPTALGIEQNTGLILLLIPSVLSFIALMLLMIFLHGKKIGSIASAADRIRWGRLFTSAALWFVMLVGVEIFFAYRDPENYTFTFNAIKFIPLVFIAVFLIPLQAWSEELFFRSYLMQGLGVLFNSRVIPLIATSILFGLMHALNPEVKEYGFWVMMLFYIGFGLFAGLLVVFDDGIEMACGVHAINNIYGAVLVSYDSSVLKTAALWKMKELNPLSSTIAFLLMAILYLFIMAKVYKWENPLRLFQSTLRT